MYSACCAQDSEFVFVIVCKTSHSTHPLKEIRPHLPNFERTTLVAWIEFKILIGTKYLTDTSNTLRPGERSAPFRMLQHTFAILFATYETSNYLKCIASTCLSPPCVLFAYETRVSMIQFVCYVKAELVVTNSGKR